MDYFTEPLQQNKTSKNVQMCKFYSMGVFGFLTDFMTESKKVN